MDLIDKRNTHLSRDDFKQFQSWCRAIQTFRRKDGTTIKKTKGMFLTAFKAGEQPQEFYNKHKINK